MDDFEFGEKVIVTITGCHPLWLKYDLEQEKLKYDLEQEKLKKKMKRKS